MEEHQKGPANDNRPEAEEEGDREGAVEVTPAMLAIIDTVRPKLIKDDMFIGDEKALEINLFTPGGLQTPNFSDSAMAALEEKVVARGTFGNRLENSRLATL